MDDVTNLKDELQDAGVRPVGNGMFEVIDHGGTFTGTGAQLRQRFDKQVTACVDMMVDGWIAASKAIDPGSVSEPHRPARALFVAAVKHLAKIAMEHPAISQSPAKRSMALACTTDVSRFSYQQMDEFVQARLVIDWTSHLAAMSQYRSELIQAYEAKASGAKSKVASAFGRNLDNPGERSVPWRPYYGDIVHRNPHEKPSSSRDDTTQERSDQLRQEQGLVDQTDGFLEHYDEIDDDVKHGRRFRSKGGTMQDIWENNQKWKDFSSVEFGARAWGDTSNLAPHEKSVGHWRG